MGCPVDFTGLSVSYACGEIASGGLKTVYLADKATLAELGAINVSTGSAVITISGASLQADLVTEGNDLLQLGFNNKDGFSNFTDVKTVNADGSASVVPTITMEFLRMNATKRNALEEIATPGAEIVAFVETAAGTKHLVGFDFGLYAGTVDGASGAARTDKNRYQLTLVGEENVFAYPIADSEWNKLV
jgi:hypothetical protein